MKLCTLLLTLIIAPFSVFANQECGKYEVRGIVRIIDKEMKIVVNEATQSQHIISFSTLAQGKIAAYVDRPITAQINFNNAQQPFNYFAKEVQSINLRVPNPLAPQDTGLKLLQSSKCKK